MTEERLKEIKDSIDFQLTIAKSLGVDDEVVLEEKELYDEIIRLKKELEKGEKNGN